MITLFLTHSLAFFIGAVASVKILKMMIRYRQRKERERMERELAMLKSIHLEVASFAFVNEFYMNSEKANLN